MIHDTKVTYRDADGRDVTRSVRLTFQLDNLIYSMLPKLKASKRGLATLCFGMIKIEWLGPGQKQP